MQIHTHLLCEVTVGALKKSEEGESAQSEGRFILFYKVWSGNALDGLTFGKKPRWKEMWTPWHGAGVADGTSDRGNSMYNDPDMGVFKKNEACPNDWRGLNVKGALLSGSYLPGFASAGHQNISSNCQIYRPNSSINLSKHQKGDLP